jgi:hypothetical protein
MRKVIHAVLAGTLTFGIIAAAASSATFGLTLEDVVRVGTVDAAASVVFVDRVCDGEYEIFWELDGTTIIGFSAYREPGVDPDDGLAFCANQPFVLQVSDGMGGWVEAEVATDTFTDEHGGILAARFMDPGGIRFEDGDQVRLIIGPEAATYF